MRELSRGMWVTHDDGRVGVLAAPVGRKNVTAPETGGPTLAPIDPGLCEVHWADAKGETLWRIGPDGQPTDREFVPASELRASRPSEIPAARVAHLHETELIALGYENRPGERGELRDLHRRGVRHDAALEILRAAAPGAPRVLTGKG
jgi:hypothetical protein